jgi:senataxin
MQMAACHLGSPPGSNDPQAHPTLPFVLIQGPPGTGKTHTVVGVLNVWHLVAYQRYYAHLVQQAQSNESGMLSQQGMARPSATRSTAGPSSAPQPPSMSRKERPDPLDMLTTGDGNAVMRLSEEARASKPRILVCTPSNAACDELLSRVMGVQFCDGNGEFVSFNGFFFFQFIIK